MTLARDFWLWLQQKQDFTFKVEISYVSRTGFQASAFGGKPFTCYPFLASDMRRKKKVIKLIIIVFFSTKGEGKNPHGFKSAFLLALKIDLGALTSL